MDGSTIKAVRELPLSAWVLFAIVAGSLAGVVLLRPDWIPEPYPNTRGWILLAAYVLLPLVILWGGWRILKAAIEAARTPRWWKVRKLQRRYRTLFDSQRELIDSVYKTGKNSFDVNLEFSKLRIFEQLENEGFIVVHPSYVYYENMPVSCSLTPECADALKGIHRLA